MGSEKVFLPTTKELQQFVVHLLKDSKALEKMLYDDIFEKEPIRIGAEQELCLIDKNWKPAMANLEVLKRANNELFTTELARFNLETNLEPMIFEGRCLHNMETRILELLAILRKAANEIDLDIVLTGILPTIRKIDLTLENLTPIERYRALCEALKKLRGTDHLELKIDGIDELMTRHDSPLMEGCNTGFQVHLQVKPDEFVEKYNIAQAIAGPALACATNSPILFNRRLWHETRIALFQQSVDVRTAGDNLRNRSARVMFGNSWVKKSILEIYQEDIMRFKVLLGSTNESKDPFKELAHGRIPSLDHLLVHNSTVYRWNRPCYGVAKNKPHLRIENRVLPAGPTVKDEVANAALWLGLLNGLGDHYKDITKVMEFDEAKSNFLNACRSGLYSRFYWTNGKRYDAIELLTKELIPIAMEGLKKANVDDNDIKHYSDILQERVKSGQTGSQWMLRSYTNLLRKTSPEEASAAVTASINKQQKENLPVHTWRDAELSDLGNWNPTNLVVSDFMQTELFTVYPNDIVQLVATTMDWRKINYVPVEDKNGNYVGLITSRQMMRFLLNHYIEDSKKDAQDVVTVKDIMLTNSINVVPELPLSEAIRMMQAHKIGGMPVVKDGKLQGMITEKDYLKVVARLSALDKKEA